MSFFSKKFFEPEQEAPQQAEKADLFEVQTEPEEKPVAPPEPVKPKHENLTVIGVGTVFEGNISTTDELEINGTMKGDIKSSTNVRISGTGLYYGDASMANINVDGRAEGNLKCEGHTVVTNTGAIKGSIVSARLTTAEGALIEASMNLNNRRKPAKPVPETPVESDPHEEALPKEEEIEVV